MRVKTMRVVVGVKAKEKAPQRGRVYTLNRSESGNSGSFGWVEGCGVRCAGGNFVEA